MVARPGTTDPNVEIRTPRDPNTLSNYHNFITKHTAATFDIDFEKRILKGQVVLTLESLTDAESKEITFDTSFLSILDVKIGGKDVKWELAKERVEPYGSPLKIELSEGVKKGEKVDVQVKVETTKDCTALQWMTPAQTSNKKHPYMFSQCQAIHARSVFPCQDTPDVKSTFSFALRR